MSGLQCGLGSAEDALRPTPVVRLAQLGCRQLAAGLAHSLATTQSGDLYTWVSCRHTLCPDEQYDDNAALCVCVCVR